jgi:PIN domain nuclease of toxin-antitoxin system
MNLLFDTHAFLWFVFDDPRMSPAVAELLESGTANVVLSVVSLWEIAIKHQFGKLELGTSFGEFLKDHVESTELEILGIEPEHLRQYAQLPLHHRDPFDRLLIAQAQVERRDLATADPQFSAYEVSLHWP